MKNSKMLAIVVLALGLMVWPGQEASGGTLAGWGYNIYGQCDVPTGNDFVAIAGGGSHSLALKFDGSLAAWGLNNYGQCDVPAGNDFAVIAGGDYHSLALKSDGSLAAWGSNDFGQCDVPEGNDFAAIAAGGGWHSLALKSDGSLAAWGHNGYGQCDVPAGNDFVAIAAGGWHSLALKSDGSLAAWGRKTEGQCDVPEGNDFAAIAAGGWHSLALKSDGSLAAWGHNGYGQCDVPAGNDFAVIAGGDYHSLALKSDGSLTAWGYNYSGQCDVPAGNDFLAIAAGTAHSLAIAVAPMGTAFTYQGRLLDEGSPAEGLYDFEFKLYNDRGIQQGNTIDINDLDVIEGQFTVELDFGSDVFAGDARWLETAVRPGDSNDPNAFVTLSPRMELTPTPYALYAKTAETAGGIPGGISGSGTADYIAKFTGPNTIGDSVIYESGGNVGIGTTNPQSKLSVGGDGFANTGVYGVGTWTGVYGSGSAAGVFGSDSDTGSYGRLGYDDKGVYGSGSVGVYGENANTGSSGRLGSGDYGVYGNGTYGGYFDGDGYFSGNVGIGTKSPAEKLEVNGKVKATAFVGDGSGLTGIATGDSDWTISGNNMYSGVSGKVGIGTDSPDERLEVEGRIRVSGNSSSIISNNTGSGRQILQLRARNTLTDGAGISLYGNGDTSWPGEIGMFAGSDRFTVRISLGRVRIYDGAGQRAIDLGAGLDYAEGFNVSDEKDIAPGAVLVIDAENPGKLTVSNQAYDSKVAGIVAGAKGQGSGVRLGTDQFDCDVALAGRVYCNVDATEAGVEPGDLLTTSATPGYAMKAADYARAQGAILGKAMESLQKGQKGQILVLVTLQ